MRKNQTIKYLGAILLAVLLSAPSVQAQLGKVFGKVMDGGETLPLTRVELRDGQTVLARSMSDMEGKYEIAKIEPGQYTVVVMSGDIEQEFGLVISPGETEIKNLVLNALDDVKIWYGEKEIFTVDPTDPITVTRREIKESGIRDPEDIIAGYGPVYQPDQGDPLNVRGGRSGGIITIQDGMKLVGPSDVPARAINQVTLLDSGIPAEYGDLTSGVLIINTYNPGMKGHKGKPMTRAERKALRERQKHPKKDSKLTKDDGLFAMGI